MYRIQIDVASIRAVLAAYSHNCGPCSLRAGLLLHSAARRLRPSVGCSRCWRRPRSRMRIPLSAGMLLLTRSGEGARLRAPAGSCAKGPASCDDAPSRRHRGGLRQIGRGRAVVAHERIVRCGWAPGRVLACRSMSRAPGETPPGWARRFAGPLAGRCRRGSSPALLVPARPWPRAHRDHEALAGHRLRGRPRQRRQVLLQRLAAVLPRVRTHRDECHRPTRRPRPGLPSPTSRRWPPAVCRQLHAIVAHSSLAPPSADEEIIALVLSVPRARSSTASSCMRSRRRGRPIADSADAAPSGCPDRAGTARRGGSQAAHVVRIVPPEKAHPTGAPRQSRIMSFSMAARVLSVLLV